MIVCGQEFGRLQTVIPAGINSDNRRQWLTQCSCGEQKIISQKHLLSGHTTSCGCFHRERTREAALRHGHKPTGKPSPSYYTWTGMRHRCFDVNAVNYARYGGRGITVCDRWAKDFKEFLKDMGERPVGLTLDRIDPSGNYEPSNCRWATLKEQGRNRRYSSKRK